jgi:hypothetical protein
MNGIIDPKIVQSLFKFRLECISFSGNPVVHARRPSAGRREGAGGLRTGRKLGFYPFSAILRLTACLGAVGWLVQPNFPEKLIHGKVNLNNLCIEESSGGYQTAKSTRQLAEKHSET